MTGKRPGDLFKDLFRVSAITLFFVGAALVLGDHHLRRYLFDVSTLRVILGSAGEGKAAWSAFMFTTGAAVFITLGVPRLLASAIGGVIYGAMEGTILSLAASLLGSSVLYLAGRAALATVVERRASGRLEEWQHRFRSNAFWWVLYGRLFPFSNSTVMSLLCGCCRVGYAPYALGSLIGFAPLAIVFSCYGSGGMRGDFLQIGVATGVLILSIVSRRVIEAWIPSQGAEVRQ